VSLTDETFNKLSSMFEELQSLQDEMLHHEYGDNSIICDCDCGCGGDIIDWETAKEEWEALEKYKDEVIYRIKAELETYAALY